jgi:chromosomal replication initiator protein
MSLDLWQRACERLAAELPEQQFNTWIRPLTATVSSSAPDGTATVSSSAPDGTATVSSSAPDGTATVSPSAPLSARDSAATPATPALDAPTTVTVRVPNRFKLDWIRTQYAARLQSLLGELAGGEVRLDLGVAPAKADGSRATSPEAPAMALRRNLPVSAVSVALSDLGSAERGRGSERETLRTSPHATAATSHRLNPALTFDTLVAGRANQMARTAALHVAGAPGVMYNPLFIYGGVGLGKTHLVHAVGNALLKDRPDARVLYLHAEQFISDVVKNYQRKTFDELKAKYHSLDLLLIDDVQFFAGKERTQEEFFNAFEALLTKRAHIIMTSDTYPKGLVDIDERLTSRFDAGLTVAIEPPELEMRVAILMRKATQEGTEMPEDVAFFVAKNVRANVRELEGALRKVLAYSRFSHKDINIHLAKDALKDLLSIQNRQVGVENIQKTVADFYKIKVADMYSKKRPASIARPRQIAMYLAKDMTKKSLPEIGELFGGRDHTTVLHAVRKIGAERSTNPELNQQLHVLEQTLKG